MTDLVTTHHTLVSKLEDFGFSRSEALVYITLLTYGEELGGTKLALLSGLHRQYVYQALPKLIENGLVVEVTRGKQSKYLAKSPQILETLGRKKAAAASDLARELNLISTIGNEQDFEVIQGARAIQAYELTYVHQAENGEAEYIIGGASESFATVMADALPEYLDVKNAKQLIVKYLGTKDEAAFYEQYIGKFSNQEYRFLDKLPKGKTHLVIRKDTVSFYTFLNPPLVYVVQSPVIAKNYKDFFMMLWGINTK